MAWAHNLSRLPAPKWEHRSRLNEANKQSATKEGKEFQTLNPRYGKRVSQNSDPKISL